MPISLKKAKNFIILFALIFCQLVLISIQVPIGDESNYFERVVFSVFSPINSGVSSVFRGIGNVWSNYFDLHNVKKNNQKLQEKVFRLNQENSLLRGILRTHRMEKDMLNLLQELEESVLPARVVGMDASNIWKSLVINKGSLDGVKKDMVVLDKNGYLVGRVVDPVSFKQSRVQLITDSQSGVYVVPREKTEPGIVNGIGNGKCRLEYILATDMTVAEGDALISTGNDGIYIPGILVGYVSSVSGDVTLFKRIEVTPAFDIRDLEVLAVILKDVQEFF